MASLMWANPGTPAVRGLSGCHPLLLLLAFYLRLKNSDDCRGLANTVASLGSE